MGPDLPGNPDTAAPGENATGRSPAGAAGRARGRMAQRKPRRRSGAKIATKKEQAELLKRARELAEDPSPLVPAAIGPQKRVANRLQRRLEKISHSKDSERRLKGFLKRGPELTRAYANLLMVAASDQAERMASTNTPVGSLKYAVRGMAPRQASVAVQHFRYPEVRVLAYRDITRKTHSLVWATPKGVALTGRKDPPPDGWSETMREHVAVELRASQDEPHVFHCTHLDADSTGRDRSPLALEVELPAGPTRFRVCDECIHTRLKERGKGLLPTVAGLVIGLKSRQIDARVRGTPRVCEHDGDCSWTRNVPTVPEQTLIGYREGRRSEADVLDKLLPLWEDRVREADERLLVAGEECYGDDEARFLDAIGETGERREVLERFLALAPRVVIAKDATMNHVLEASWEVAPRVLKELHPYKGELEQLLKKHAKSPPAAVVDEVLEARRARAVLKGYPRYNELPAAARSADRVARAYRTDGEAGMIAAVEKELDSHGPHKGVLWAALRLAGQQETQRWRFDKISIEAGEFLEGTLKELTETDAGAYHEKLAQLHTLAGGQGSIPEPVGKV